MGERKRATTIDLEDERIERLIAASEAAANAMNRLCQEISNDRVAKKSKRPMRMRQTIEVPAKVTAKAARDAERALEKLGLRKR